MPALNAVQRKAQFLRGMNNLKQVHYQVDLFANDHHNRYPPSVATVGSSSYWNWYDPRQLAAPNPRPGARRSMSAYLGNYIENPSILECPSAPEQYPYMEEMWEAGDSWDHPDTLPPGRVDQMKGSFCFYWGYVGLIDLGTMKSKPFIGPVGQAGGRRSSKLLACDYLGKGSGHDDPPYTFSSCEPFDKATMNQATNNTTSYWTRPMGQPPVEPALRLKALYMDGSVDTYSAAETKVMKVISNRQTRQTYSGYTKDSPGLFYLPDRAMH